jgi:hypothetical protein
LGSSVCGERGIASGVAATSLDDRRCLATSFVGLWQRFVRVTADLSQLLQHALA